MNFEGLYLVTFEGLPFALITLEIFSHLIMTFYTLFINFIKIFHLLLAFFITIFYMPQTYRYNPVTRKLMEWNQFLTYTEAKEFVRFVNPVSIILFVILSAYIGLA